MAFNEVQMRLDAFETRMEEIEAYLREIADRELIIPLDRDAEDFLRRDYKNKNAFFTFSDGSWDGKILLARNLLNMFFPSKKSNKKKRDWDEDLHIFKPQVKTIVEGMYEVKASEIGLDPTEAVPPRVIFDDQTSNVSEKIYGYLKYDQETDSILYTAGPEWTIVIRLGE